MERPAIPGSAPRVPQVMLRGAKEKLRNSFLYWLSLIIAPEVEDAIIDWLLLCDHISGFTSIPVTGHGSSIHSLSTAEQVTGRRRQMLIQICLPRKDGEQVVKALQSDFAGSGMHYWLSPLQAAGHLG